MRSKALFAPWCSQRHGAAHRHLSAHAIKIAVALWLAACEQEEPPPSGGGASDIADGLGVDIQHGVCKTADDCPAAAQPCLKAVCTIEGTCGTAPVADGQACADNDPCTADEACSNGSCVGAKACECQSDQDCLAKEDGDLCNGKLFCDTALDKPICASLPASIVTCNADGDTACSKNTCLPATGACTLMPVGKGTPCHDGEACTSPDACADGVCSGPSSCACQVDSDCAGQNDKNPCNGTLYCDKSDGKPGCKVNPATVIACPAEGNTACMKSQCQPADGTCKVAPLPEGAGCDLDGSSCSADTCQSGTCAPGALQAACDCKSDADCAPFDDGNLCNGTLFCNNVDGKCTLNPATVVLCANNLDTACVANACNPVTGQCKLTPAADGAPCDDGWDCSTNESCLGGECAAKEGKCLCNSTADCAKYAGDNGCAKLYCHKPAGICKANPATLVDCPPAEDPLCADNVCDKKTGLCNEVGKNDGGPCEADGSWCTGLDTCKSGSCKKGGPKCPCQKDGDCDSFDDGNPCNGSLYCDKPSGNCLPNPASVPVCTSDGDGPCKPMQCDSKDGKCKAIALPDAATCDTDGFVCTAEACQAGACKLLLETCLCWEDGDCGPFEDGDACNGKLYCDKLAGPPNCKVNPATVVTCPPADAVGSGLFACQVPTCQKASGKCEPKPSHEGKPCDDDDACSKADTCKGGACVGLPLGPTPCDDANPCTTDSCDKQKGCQTTANGGTCTDGDACTSGDGCVGGACKAQGKTLCDDSNPCTTDTCDKQKGCQTVPNAEICDDGDACSKDDLCVLGACKGAGIVTCDDSNPCTKESCDKQQGCQSVANDASCDDGDLCTTGDVCSGGACKGAGAFKCDDNNPCTTDSCQMPQGCLALPNSVPCDDGNLCTTSDVCSGGACKGSGTLQCDDGNPCTTDSCQVPKGCLALPNSAPCDDGKACSTGDACTGGACKGTGVKACDDSNPCTKDTCDNQQGCQTAQTSGPCDDGDACTKADGCIGGACKGQDVPCDDGNPCTDDSCDSQKGCQVANNAGLCDDGDLCTKDDLCLKGVCAGQGATVCNDGKACTSDICDAAKGCVYSPKSGPCDDNNPCSIGDACDKGLCKPTGPLDCDDKNVCTADSCDAAKGCVHFPLDKACNDGDACTTDEVCAAGSCKAGLAVVCNDENLCTTDTCDKSSGCVFTKAADGKLCSGLWACANPATCQSGACTTPAPTNFSGVVATDPIAGDTAPPRLFATGSESVGAFGFNSGNGKWSWITDNINPAPNAPPAAIALDTPKGFTDVSFKASFPFGDVQWYGGVGKVAGVDRGFIVEDAGLGKFETEIDFSSATAVVSVDDAIHLGDGELGVVSTAGKRFGKFNKKGDALQLIVPTISGETFHPARVVAAGTDRFLLAGVLPVGTNNAPIKLQIIESKTGQPISVIAGATLNGNGSQQVVDVARSIHGDLWLVSTLSHTVDGTLTRLARVSPQTAIPALDVALPFKDATLTGVTRGKTGIMHLSGHSLASGKWVPFIAAYGATGALLSQRALELPQAAKSSSLVSLAGGAVVLAGATVGGKVGTNAPFTLVIDSQQHPTCGKGLKCDGFAPTGCDDGAPCTVDWCDADKGCTSIPAFDGYLCQDGNACTTNEACAGGACKGGQPVDCDDGNLCKAWSCEPATGCKVASMPDGTNCVGGACASGACVAITGAPTIATGPTTGAFIYDDLNTTSVYGFGWAVSAMLPGATPNIAHNVGKIAGTDDAQLVSVGDRLACFVKTNGALHCWGSAVSAFDIAKPIANVPPVTWIAVRNQKACATVHGGDVYCMDGQGKFTLTLATVGGKPWVGVTVGLEHTCAWQHKGEVRCWGNGNVFAQLGTGMPLPGGAVAPADAKPVVTTSAATLTGVTQMCAGLRHSCARTTDNKVHCWGHGLYGQIGNSSLALAPAAAIVPASGQGMFGFSAGQVHCGDNTTYVQALNGNFVVWGRGDQGQIGNTGFKDTATWTTLNGVPFGSRGGQSASAVCAVDGIGLTCWGSNETGVLGRYSPGAARDPYVPSAVLRAEDAKEVADATALRGVGGVFVVDTLGDRYAFGNSVGGGAMPGHTQKLIDAAIPIPAELDPSSRSSPRIGCVLGATGDISCWGANPTQYVAGISTNPAQIETPVTISTNPPATALFVGTSHSCATTTDASQHLRCWGRNQDGELGIGVTGGPKPISTVAGISNVAGLAMAPGRTCASTNGKEVYCWGANKYGEGGLAAVGAITQPIKVNGPAMVRVAASACVTCAISADAEKAVYCWGYNGNAAINYLGAKASGATYHIPQKVVGISGALEVALTDASAIGNPCSGTGCAVLADGTVRCWGGSFDAQLGQGNAATISADQQPHTVGNVTGALQIVSGDRAFCVRAGAGNVRCWGQRGYSQTGEKVSVVSSPTDYSTLISGF